MTVRDKVGRTRYVAFRVREGAPVPRHDLDARLPEGARLTRFDGTYGIVRVTHRARDALVAHLGALREAGGRALVLETLATSGTLRGAAAALPASAATRTRPSDRFK